VSDPWEGLDRDEEPWRTMDIIWRELWDYRERLLDDRANYQAIGVALGYLDGKLEASGFVQGVFFREMLEMIKRKRNGDTG
jgi:hypothetical protein